MLDHTVQALRCCERSWWTAPFCVLLPCRPSENTIGTLATMFRRLHSARVGQLLKKCIYVVIGAHSVVLIEVKIFLVQLLIPLQSFFHPSALSNQFPSGVFEYPHGELLPQVFFFEKKKRIAPRTTLRRDCNPFLDVHRLMGRVLFNGSRYPSRQCLVYSMDSSLRLIQFTALRCPTGADADLAESSLSRRLCALCTSDSLLVDCVRPR